MHSNKYIFCLDFRVRDYECDLQGIVNNANYLHYLEHTRHEFLLSKGISFSDLHNEGTDLIIVRIEIDYKFPLKSKDSFKVCLNVRRKEMFELHSNRIFSDFLITNTLFTQL